MKLSLISLIASALAATAGSTFAAPGPPHARSSERDVDSVDLFTRNPADPFHHNQAAQAAPARAQSINGQQLADAHGRAGRALRTAQADAEYAVHVIPERANHYNR